MKVVNRKAFKDFQIIEKIEAGIALKGPEVKSVKERRVKLEGAYIKLSETGAFLVNSFIAPYKFADNEDYDPWRTRRLLLHKKEIIRLRSKIKQVKGLTIIPLSIYSKRGLIKIEIALVKGRKKFEKIKIEKEKSIKREIDREIKRYLSKS